MLRSALGAVALTLSLVACVEAPDVVQSAPAAVASAAAAPVAAPAGPTADIGAAAAVIAADFDRGAGANLGALTLLGGRAEGNVVIMETRLRFARSYIARPQAMRAFRRFVCEEDVYAAFLSLGGEIHFEIFGFGSNSSQTFVIDRCW